ncbi:MAG TPA: sensor histidine kinase [Phenylobacterium sp.]|nr:sensor histidine kinase [Phenylobacterium sp.]
MVEAELAALAFPGASTVSGPETLLPPHQVQAMSMILHELATNAAKYGALGAAAGLVTVSWRREGPQQLVLTWREEGGPATRRPSRSGFGSRMVRQLARQLRGTIRFEWRSDGLTAELTAVL